MKFHGSTSLIGGKQIPLMSIERDLFSGCACPVGLWVQKYACMSKGDQHQLIIKARENRIGQH